MTARVRVTAIPLAVAAVLRFATVAAATGLDRTSECFTHTYPLAPDGRVSLAKVGGNIRITGWDHNEVQLETVKYDLR